MINTKDKILFVVGILLITILVLIGFFYTPQVKETVKDNGITSILKKETSTRAKFVEPLQDTKAISIVPQVTVVFSDSIVGKNVSLKSEPAIKFGVKLNKTGEKATFSPTKELKPKTKYKLQVLVDDNPIFRWEFTTRSRGTNQNNLAKVVNSIRSKTPYIGKGFRVSYDAATDQFFIFVEKAPVESYKRNANSWLRKQGLKDFGALNINYVVKGSLQN